MENFITFCSFIGLFINFYCYFFLYIIFYIFLKLRLNVIFFNRLKFNKVMMILFILYLFIWMDFFFNKMVTEAKLLGAGLGTIALAGVGIGIV